MIRQPISGVLAVFLLVVTLVWVVLVSHGVSAQDDPTPSPDLDDVLELARNFSGGNADWTPVIQELDGVEMVLVPAGCFEMGSTQYDYDDEKPVHQVCFEEAFWIDQTEVTNGQFAAFNGQAASASYWKDKDRPREQISWIEATAFCASRGGHLPTEAEWEYAARGPDGLEYPWGNEWDQTRVIGYRDTNKGTAPVGSLPDGASWVGALDMSGNVYEWVADWYDANYYGTVVDGAINPTGPASGSPTGLALGEYRVLRGGLWYGSSTDVFRAANRSYDDPSKGYLLWGVGFGFRCARSMDANSALSAITVEPTPEPTPVDPETAALPAGAHNADWTPVIQEFDGVAMVLVPAGCFMMGSEEGYDNAKPIHQVCFEEPFWIDQTEVTNGQFAAFNGRAAEASYFSGDDRPREWITWTEAAAYCESRGARLPTEAEWEYAARGPDGLVYPWGNEWDQSRVIVFRGSGEGTASVGSIPAGASWVGALDLSGNVWEWVADWYGPYPEGSQVNPQGPDPGESHVLRGGSWAYPNTYAFRAANRGRLDPQLRKIANGFRCARSRARRAA